MAKLEIKLPHNPLFHMYKTIFDVLIENEVNEYEVE